MPLSYINLTNASLVPISLLWFLKYYNDKLDKSYFNNTYIKVIPANNNLVIDCATGGKQYVYLIEYGNNVDYYAFVRFTRNGKLLIFGQLNNEYISISTTSGVHTISNLKTYDYSALRLV